MFQQKIEESSMSNRGTKLAKKTVWQEKKTVLKWIKNHENN